MSDPRDNVELGDIGASDALNVPESETPHPMDDEGGDESRLTATQAQAIATSPSKAKRAAKRAAGKARDSAKRELSVTRNNKREGKSPTQTGRRVNRGEVGNGGIGRYIVDPADRSPAERRIIKDLCDKLAKASDRKVAKKYRNALRKHGHYITIHGK